MLIDQFKQAIKDGKPLFIKSYMNYDFDWEDVVNLIDMAYNNPVGEELKEGEVSDLLYNADFNRSTSLKVPTGGVTFHAEDILNPHSRYKLSSNKYDSVKRMKHDLEQLDLDSTVYGKFSINMSTASPKVYPHRDTHHVLLTQVIGKATYVIHESKESDPYRSYIPLEEGRPFTEYHMEKNDILFMPYGTIHSIDNNSIRVACIFDIIKKHELH